MQNYNSNGAWVPGTRQALILGNREDIGLVGLYPDKRRGGLLTAVLRTGFLTAEGWKEKGVVRTATTDHAAAQLEVEALIQQLQSQWDQFAAALAKSQPTSSAAAAPLVIPSTERVIHNFLDAWSQLPRRSATLHSYTSAARRFVQCSGAVAKLPPGSYTVENCLKIREQMLSSYAPEGASRRQLMHNLRYILRETAFPEHLVQVFQIPGRVRSFPASTRRAIISNLAKAPHTTQGLVLLSANGGHHVGDLACATADQVRQAQQTFAEGKRIKTGNPFTFVLWPMTQAWVKDALNDPKAYYLFPELMFSAAELANPGANQGPVEEDALHARARRFRAARKATHLIRQYLQQIGVSGFHGFRHTALREWEQTGLLN